jgi:hypothetical protein
MLSLRRLLPWIGVAAGLLLSFGLLAPARVVYAGDTPPTEPGMGEPGMADAGMSDAGMADGGDAADPNADDEDDDTPLPLIQKVGKAIDKGVAYLKQHQNGDGSWGPIKGDKPYPGQKGGEPYTHPSGSTSLALYALLKCHVPIDDPSVKRGFKFLKDRYKMPGGSYEASMMLLAVTATADPFKKFSKSQAEGDKVKLTGEFRDWAQKLQQLLLKKKDKNKTQGWRYQIDTVGPIEGGDQDLSSTQLATLALLAAERCGIKTEDKVWTDILEFSMRQQSDDGPEWDRAVYDKQPKPKKDAAPPASDPDRSRYGPPANPAAPTKDRARGFAYIKSDKLPPHEGQPTGSMTACGVGNVQMVRYIMGKRDTPAWQQRDQKKILQSVYDGCAWIDMNWSAWDNPNHDGYHVYYLYCVERAFDLIGNNLIGKHFWYQEMAEQLVGKQHDKGDWNSHSTHQPHDVLDTAFALLVLKRSTKGGIPYSSITNPGDEPPSDNRGK